jgi:hypothetical protein
MSCEHDWSIWWECVSPKLEYRVCYKCHRKEIEDATEPPRWVTDRQGKARSARS